MSKNRPVPVEHPGTFIKEELEARNWDQVDLAYILGMLPQQINPLLNGKANITADLAALLGVAFDMPADFFANLQKLYDLHRTKPVDPGVRTRANWLSVFPVRDMIKRGWIEETEPSLLDVQMMRFFGKNSVDEIPFMGGSGAVPAHAAMKSGGYDATTPPQYTWLHRVITIAKNIQCAEYSEMKLREALPTIRKHFLDKDDLRGIPEILAQCGVRFIVVEPLPGSKIDGVCAWVDGQPVIGMTTRHDRLDNFAFVLRHECEHILQGDGRSETYSPVDEIAFDFENSDLPASEVRANQAASEFCVPKQQLQSFLLRKGQFISEQDVLAFSARLEIHPAIVIGQIQHKTNKYGWLRKYQAGIRQYLMDWKYVDGWGTTFPTSL